MPKNKVNKAKEEAKDQPLENLPTTPSSPESSPEVTPPEQENEEVKEIVEGENPPDGQDQSPEVLSESDAEDGGKAPVEVESTEGEPDSQMHVLTAEDLAANPHLLEEGFKEGDNVLIPSPSVVQPETGTHPALAPEDQLPTTSVEPEVVPPESPVSEEPKVEPEEPVVSQPEPEIQKPVWLDVTVWAGFSHEQRKALVHGASVEEARKLNA